MTSLTIHPTVPEQVYAALVARGYSRDDLAAELGITRSYLDHLLIGAVTPSAPLLQRLAAWLQVPLDQLLAPPPTPLTHRRIIPFVIRVRQAVRRLRALAQHAQDAELQALGADDPHTAAYHRGLAEGLRRAATLVHAALPTPPAGDDAP